MSFHFLCVCACVSVALGASPLCGVFDFARLGVPIPAPQRSKTICGVRVSLLAPTNVTLFYVTSTGVGMGTEAPTDAAAPLPPGRNDFRVEFSTRVQVLQINFTALLNVSINATIESIFGPPSDDELARGVSPTDVREPTLFTVVPGDADSSSSSLQWQPPSSGKPLHCTALSVRGVGMPASTLLLQALELRSLGLNFTRPDDAPAGDVEIVNIERARTNRTRATASGGGGGGGGDGNIWGSWIPWTALGGCLLVLCACALLIVLLRRRIAAAKEERAEAFFQQVELEKVVEVAHELSGQ
jgi:hypothetical protein